MKTPQSDLTVQPLTDLTGSQFKAPEKLTVSPRQEVLGGSFLESLQAWRDGPQSHVLGLCFLHEDHPIGMTLFKRPPLSPPWVTPQAASIHGLKISQRWQGRGWGSVAFHLAIDALRNGWPDVKTLLLAVDAENTVARAVYRAAGMSDSGPIYEGRVGREHRMQLAL